MLGNFPKALPKWQFPISGSFPNVQFSIQQLGKLHIWEFATWENNLWRLPLGKCLRDVSFNTEQSHEQSHYFTLSIIPLIPCDVTSFFLLVFILLEPIHLTEHRFRHTPTSRNTPTRLRPLVIFHFLWIIVHTHTFSSSHRSRLRETISSSHRSRLREKNSLKTNF